MATASTDLVTAYITGTQGERITGFGDGWDPMPSGTGSEATLERIVYASLFTDARLDADLSPSDGSDDHRGWWADALEPGRSSGSLLWDLLGRPGVKARQVEDTVREALTWMVTERLCSAVYVTVTITGLRATATVELALASGERVPVAFPDLWSAYG